jgi:hypothetical protein
LYKEFINVFSFIFLIAMRNLLVLPAFLCGC